MMEKKYRLGIALSGGGARGIAHIGVLQALEEHGIYPEVIAGTSAGAIVGALYAAGNSPAQILDFVKKTSILKTIRLFSLPTRGLTDLSALAEVLKEYIPDDDFSALSKPLYIATSNLSKGRLEIIHEGPLFEVITASSSIPLVFKPVKRNDDLYVDGGLMRNLPVEPLREQCDFVIGVNVMPMQEVANRRMQSMIGIANRTFEMSVKTNTIPSSALCDWVIEPEELRKVNVFNFRIYKKIYQIGYKATQVVIPEIKTGLQLS